MKKIIAIIMILLLLLIENVSGYQYSQIKNVEVINETFYYNNSYIKDKKEILLSFGQNLRGGIKKCFKIGKKYFYTKRNINKFCMYQIKHFIQEINHPISKKFPYNKNAENNFFYHSGKNIIDNNILQYININKKETKVTIDYSDYQVDYNGTKVNKYIISDLKEMNSVYKEKFGGDIILNSGYRSIKKQTELYKYYVKTYGEHQKIATTPGFSEHHLGTAIDIKKVILENGYKNYDWLKKNSWKYGFILSYNSFCESEGIINEDWHYRWVGKKIAMEWKNWQYNNKEKCNISFLEEINNK